MDNRMDGGKKKEAKKLIWAVQRHRSRPAAAEQSSHNMQTHIQTNGNTLHSWVQPFLMFAVGICGQEGGGVR